MDRFDQLAATLVQGARDSFQSQKDTAEKAIAQLDDGQLHACLSPATNSIAVIMAHVAGNLRSRWTDFLTTDGEKTWRHRDGEFEPRACDRATLWGDWEDGWRCVFGSLEQLRAEDLLRSVTIRGAALTVPMALQRSLAHTAYHVGQILLQSRALAGDEWQTITIPRGQSEQYNRQHWGTAATHSCATTDDARHAAEILAQDEQISYQVESWLTPAAFIDLLKRSTLAARRPIDETGTVAGMLRHADVIVTARERTPNGAGLLVGVSRAISDFSYCTYLSDLAVDEHYQRRGIGRQLIEHTHAVAGRGTTLILLAAPAARAYYPHIGMQSHDSCWITWRQPRG